VGSGSTNLRNVAVRSGSLARRPTPCSMRRVLRGLIVVVLGYPLSCVGYVVVCHRVDRAAAQQLEDLRSRLEKGMSSEQVQAAIGRPPDVSGLYLMVTGGSSLFSHEWVAGNRTLQVVFRDDQLQEARILPGANGGGAVRHFLDGLFFWWLKPFELD